MSIPSNLKKYRKKRGFTQKKLSTISGISFSMISKLESGEKKNPSFETISKLANALNIQPNQLLYNNNLSYDLLNAVYNSSSGVYKTRQGGESYLESTIQSAKYGKLELSYENQLFYLETLKEHGNPNYESLKLRVENEKNNNINASNIEPLLYSYLEKKYGSVSEDSFGILVGDDLNNRIKLSYAQLSELSDEIYRYIDFYIYNSKKDDK